MKFYSGNIENLKENEIFVFGSNPEGRHGAGAAKVARTKFGAKYGNGRGIQGNSYALPTKNLKAGYIEKSTGIKYEKAGEQSISLEQIRENIKELYKFAKENPNLIFKIAYKNETRNLNGYTSEEMFRAFVENQDIPENIEFSDTFIELYKQILNEEKKVKKQTKIKEMKIKVVNIATEPEVKKEENYIYCGRGSALGNPYQMKNKSKEERNRVCNEYEKYIKEEIKNNQEIKNQLNLIWNTVRKHGEAKIGCFCAPKRCHCETIKEILENKFNELQKKEKNKIKNNIS
jgi:hypothetical protein